MSRGRFCIREATRSDRDSVTCLWREFGEEKPEPSWRAGNSEDHLCARVEAIGTDVVLLAEWKGEPAGLAVADVRDDRVGYLHILLCVPVPDAGVSLARCLERWRRGSRSAT